ncbi:22696_t:CDS:2, partial [Cetraspora pellucida]
SSLNKPEMSLPEVTQNLAVEVSSEGTTSQVEESLKVDWNHLCLTDLRTMCVKCNIPMDGTKAELVACLEDFWTGLDDASSPPKLDKGKTVEQLSEDFGERQGPHFPDVEGQNLDFLSYMESRLEQKIEEKLGDSLPKILDRSLQQWSAKLNKPGWTGAVEASFPRKSFKKSQDQHEYNAIQDAGTLLEKVIQEGSMEKTAEVQELLRLRAFVLRVAEEEGWNVAAKIPKPTPDEGDEFKELLVEARKQAKPYEGCSTSYAKKSWRNRKNDFWALSHTAAVCPSKSEENKQNNDVNGHFGSRQGVEISGRSHSSIKELSEKAKKLARDSVSPFIRQKLINIGVSTQLFARNSSLNHPVGIECEEGKLSFLALNDPHQQSHTVLQLGTDVLLVMEGVHLIEGMCSMTNNNNEPLVNEVTRR